MISIMKEEMGNLKRTINHLQIVHIFANIRYKIKISVTKNTLCGIVNWLFNAKIKVQKPQEQLFKQNPATQEKN